MVEGDIAHGLGTITKINLCVMRCPLPPYIKEEGGRRGRPPRGAPGEVLLTPGGGLPPLALWEKEGGRGKEERGAPCNAPGSDAPGVC